MESITTSANNTFFNNNANNFYFDYSNDSHTAADSQFDNSYEYVSSQINGGLCLTVGLVPLSLRLKANMKYSKIYNLLKRTSFSRSLHGISEYLSFHKFKLIFKWISHAKQNFLQFVIEYRSDHQCSFGTSTPFSKEIRRHVKQA